MPEETVYGPILLDINLWESTVRAKVEDYHEIGQLISQRYRVDCEYSFFASVIANTDIPGTKSEYIQDFGEITVYSATLIHNAIRDFDWRAWIRDLPGHPALHTSSTTAALANLFELTSDSRVVYRKGVKPLVFAADVQLVSLLRKNPARCGIIFEVTYPGHIDHARIKTKYYLWDADPPRPSVVILFNFIEKSSHCCRDVELHFEVHRRDASSTTRETTIHETGIAWPRHKSKSTVNVQDIEFSLEEIFGSVQNIDDAIVLRQQANTMSNREKGRRLALLPEGILEILQDRVKVGAKTTFPISRVTDAIGFGMELQRDEWHGVLYGMKHEGQHGAKLEEEHDAEQEGGQ